MKVGILGLECAGKKTLFRILSDEGRNVVKRGAVESSHTAVIDPRLTFLSDLYKPKKTTYAHLEFVLIPPLTGDSKNDNQVLGLLHQVDGLLLVLRGFDLEGLPPADPAKEFRTIRDNIVFSDLVKAESVLEKAVKRHQKTRDPAVEREIHLLERCRKALEENRPLAGLEFDPQERTLLRTYDFLSRKPLFALLNIPEDRVSSPPGLDFDASFADALSLRIEEEIVRLDPAEQKEFLASLGLQEPALHRILRGAYRMMDLISFFTTGEDEVKAWTIRNGTTAKEAAGVIHSDIERGFIRAEVVAYDDFVRAGNEKEAKRLNLYRLEGKDYVMKDGDIVHFRFNV